MTDLQARFQVLDELRPPDLWGEIESRSVATQRLPNNTHHVALIVATVLLIAMIWAVASVGPGGSGEILQALPPATSGAASATPGSTAIGSWMATGSMTGARHGHTATLLADGRVLVAGGFVADTGLASVELYDPRTRSWTATGSMIQARGWHTATLLVDGTVLAAGGVSVVEPASGTDVELASAELYDPRTGSWTAAGNMAEARAGPTATLLPEGRVLVAGGWGSTEPFGPRLASAELYDPATRTWTATTSMSERRHGQSATLLPNGRVLIAGGYDIDRSATAELYDPITGTWTSTGNLPEPFLGHAVALPDGTVLIAGGDVPRGGGAVGSAHAALYDPVLGTWTMTGSMNTARLAMAASLLPDGRVLVSGGRVNGGPTAGTFASAERYDPVTGTWTSIADMTISRSGHTATLLPGGRVLVVGGVTGSEGEVLASAELYDPAL